MKTKINLQEIPLDKFYEGYLWWSNQETPVVFKNEVLSNKLKSCPKETDNPFIIEGNLWNKVDKTSYLIRFMDGKYLVYKFDMKTVDLDAITKHKYLPNRMPGIDKLEFKEIWMPIKDPLCEGFEVLKPAFIAFVGFKKQEE